ncbi:MULTISPECIES: S41 family peptidase [Phyllobacteriaceae]|jgi:Peptidase family S41|uniref:Uncharacterized protein n=1 Tax=Mesorhizobium hungaricum TaxID=1566387 RepID=A0A1C2DC87_9HYPH|nr:MULTISPECIES: S41 family peptidase [Mesorhizobium]MBN9236760.1 hypothetical protein [Mesorhizobium sp.]MDQ0331133.1 hypothetical protein [Mesorhizobium sp. YL-MeA3-2017]OCX12370.1 hypothetical protein QV13_22245 [Mesorhizobium hungaricum]
MAGSVRPARRWLKRIAIALVAVLLLVVAPAAFILYPALKSYPAMDFPLAASPAEKNLRDLAYLRLLPQVERSFTDQTRAAFEAALDKLVARAPELDRAGLAMGAARAVALADNGHTNILGLVGGNGFNAVPVRLGWFADDLFVVSAAADQRDLLGAQVLALNGHSPEQLVEALRPYTGGPANLAREFVPNFLISPELLHAAGLAENADAAEFRVRQRDGVEVVRRLAAVAGTPEPLARSSWPKRDLSPVRRKDSEASWVHVLDGAAPPSYLSRPDDNFWHSYLENDGILYVQLNRIGDQEKASIEDYLSGLLAEVAKRKVKHAVVDLRFNPGGNYLLAADFTRRLPELLPPDGKVFILTSGNTFSAGISTAARLKYFAGSRAVLIGEAMGDRPQSWGEGGTARMPNSKLAIRYTTGYHDWQNGCGLAQIRTCFVLNYFYGTPSGSLTPTVPVAPTFASYAAGDDAVLAEALKLAK